MNDHEAKQEARRKRYLERAEAAEAESTREYQRSRQVIDHIPMGQPILVGHHSEKGHRRDLERADNAMRRSIGAQSKAAHYRAKAAAVGSGGISSDDPEAVDKLREKLAKLEASQERMKATNKAYRKGGFAAVAEAGLIPPDAVPRLEAKMESCWDKKPFPSYTLTNNNANIRRIRQRIQQLEAADEREPAEDKIIGEATISENTAENRVQIFFETKPEPEARAILKQRGFRWSRTNEAWQRHLNNAGIYAAEVACKQIAGQL